ncbi:exported hypothetical protein [Candidatus Desulfosporosinus infrequens]|uniref:DUF4073 domain-containing protein n=1 Tax=Candidatus Desulfosporosinus infrequens TaxID=2043169 RepID=A0A2U3LQ41_9FIRM|nr:exported hypothetical protein [Candidatus Desulfosporosinus infrequens]
MKKNTTNKTLATLAIAGMALTMVPFNAFADTGVTTARLFGSDRVGTSVAVADAGWTTATTAILAPAADTNLVDALAAAPLAGKTAPILLTDNNTLTSTTQAELVKLGVKMVYVVGAINQTVVDQVNAMSGVSAVVLKGADRIGTATAISAKLTAPAGSFVVGYGALADALSVASYAAANNYSILVANPDGSLPASEAAYQGSNVYIVGGPTLVADIPGAIRLFGADRFATNQIVLSALTYKYDHVYVANGTDAHLVDSLVASSLAAESGAPIVLTDTMGDGSAASSSVKVKLPANAVVTALGGSTVVPDAVVAQITNGAGVSVLPPVVGPVTISPLTIVGQLVGTGALSSPAVALINNGVTVSSVVSGASATNANITYLVSTSNNITAKDTNGNTLVATTLNSPIIVGNDTFSASYTVPTDANGNVKAVFSSTASSQQSFNVVVEAPFSNNGQPVMSNEASVEWGVPGTTVLSPVYTSSNPDGLNFSTAGAMKGLVPVVATMLPAPGSTTPVSGQPIKFTMTQTGGTANANAYFTDAAGMNMVSSGAAVGNGGSSTTVIYVVNTDANGQALVYINSNLPTTNGLADPGASMKVSVNAQLVNGGGSTNSGNYQWRAVAQATRIGNVSPSAMLNPTGVTEGTTLVATNAETATSGSQMTISGTVQDSAGNPVSNATVAVQDYDVVNGASNNVQNDAYVVNGTTTLFSAVNYPVVTTDSNGNFSVVVTANVPVTQSVLDSVTKYYAYYVPPTIAVTTGQSLPTTVTPLTFVGNSNNGDFIDLVWQQGQTVQSVGVSHTSLMPNYATLSAVPQTTSFSNVVGSDEQMYVAGYNQNGTIIAPASGNQFDGYALTYDITAPSGVYFDLLGSVTLPTMTTTTGTYGIGEIKAHYTQTGGFVVDSATYNDPNLTSATAALLAGTNPYATAYDGSGQLNFYLQSNNTSAVISSGTAGSVNVNISAYSNSAVTLDLNHAQGSAAGMINAAFTASNTIGSLGVAADPTGFNQYIPLLDGNAAPGSTVTIAGVAIPGNNAYDPSRNASFVAAPFNSYPALSTVPSQGLTMNMSTSLNGVISNVDGYTLTTMPNNVSVNVNSVGEVSVNNVKLWTAQPGYKVVGYMPSATSGSVTLIEENRSTLTSFIGVNVLSAGSAGSQVATWTLPSSSLPGNFEEFLGFNVSATGQLQPMVASYFKNNGNSFAPYSTEVSSITAGVFNPVELAQVYASDKYSENPVVTVSNSLNSKTATITENFTAAMGGLVAIQANPSSVNSVLGGTQNITLTAEDSYGNPIANQTIYLGPGTTGLWLTQVNGITIMGSVNMGTTSSTSMQTVNTPVPLFNVANPPAYTSASISGITAYNLNTANPVIALQTGSSGTVSLTLADGNVMYVANNATATISNSYTVDPGTSITGQTINLYSNSALTAKLGSVLVNWGSSGHSGGSGSSNVGLTGISPLNTIGGTAQVGVVLTAGALTPAAATVTYQWQTCDTVGGTYANISGATLSTYTPAAGDLGKYIQVVATGIGGYSGTVTSAAVAVVAAPAPITAVNVTGVVAPVTGAAPMAVGALTAGATTYTKTSITWLNSDGTPATLKGGNFNATSIYKASIVLTSSVGNKFPVGGLTPTVNTGIVGAGTVGGGDVSGNTLTFLVSFPATVVAPAAPSVTADDANNVIVGANATLEYSTNAGASYTAYNTTTVPTFVGNQTVLVRVAANATTGAPAGAVTTLTFTTNPVAPAVAPSVTADDANNVIVGANATLEYSTNAGVSYTAYNTTTVPTFAGNQTVLVRVAANVTTGAPAGVVTILTFTTNPVAPAAPAVTADDANNVIVGADGTMEYSTNAGTNYTAYNPTAAPIFAGNQSVLVRVAADTTLGAPVGAVTTLTFTTNPVAPAAPAVTADDANNVIVGADGTMEYSTNAGTNYTAYNPTAAPTFVGNQSVLVRVAANATLGAPAGAVTTLTFTTNPVAPAAPAVTADDANNVIIGADASMEYSTNAGTNYTAYNATTAPTFAGNQTVLVRVVADATLGTPAGAVTTLSFTTNPGAPAAPAVNASDANNVIVGADGTMEYSTNAGVSYTTYNVTTAPTFAGNQTVLVRVAANATTGAPAGAVTTLTFTTP